MAGKIIENRTRNGEPFEGYLTEPEGTEALPGLLIIPAIFGVDEEMRMLADAWAADGFVVSVPDIFWRQLPGPTADLEVALGRMNAFDSEQGLEDVEDLVRGLRALPRCNGKVAVLGFCFGGRYAFVSVSRFGANAAGAFHGTGIGLHLDEADAVNVPVSFHFGREDPVIAVEEVQTIAAALGVKPNAQVILHDEASHNFSMPQKPGYHPAVAKTARDAVLACFRSM